MPKSLLNTEPHWKPSPEIRMEEIIADITHSNSAVRELDLSERDIDDAKAKQIAKALVNKNCTVEHLNLSQTNLSCDGAALIAKALSDAHCRLQSLNFSGTSLNDSGRPFTNRAWSNIIKGLKNKNNKLLSLDVANPTSFAANGVSEGDINSLFKALLDKHCHLKELNLLGSSISPKSTKMLANILKDENCPLRKLGLWGTNLDDKKVELLAEGLSSKNCQLEELDLGFNSISPDALMKMIQSNDSLFKVENIIENPGFKEMPEEELSHFLSAIEDKLEQNKMIKIRELEDKEEIQDLHLTQMQASAHKVSTKEVEHAKGELKDIRDNINHLRGLLEGMRGSEDKNSEAYQKWKSGGAGAQKS